MSYKQEYPFTVQFGIVDGCNQSYSFCGMQGRECEIHYTEYFIYKHLVSMLKSAGFKGRIRLDLYGEPTLHPHILDIISYIKKELPACHITLFTNGFGVYAGRHTIDDYFRSGVGDIIFDVYTNTVSMYEKSGVNTHPNAVINCVGTPFFVKTKRVLINLPIEEQQGIKTRTFVNHCGAGAPALLEPLQARCAHPFRDFTVNSWGEIMLCCNDFRGEYLVGNITEFATFDAAWNSPRLVSARKSLYHKDRSFNPCCKCNSKSHRVGLLPDKMGKEELDAPTTTDKEICTYNYPSYHIKPKRRQWET